MSIPLDLSRGCDSGFVFRGIVYAEGKTTTTVFDGLMESHVFLIDYPWNNAAYLFKNIPF